MESGGSDQQPVLHALQLHEMKLEQLRWRQQYKHDNVSDGGRKAA